MLRRFVEKGRLTVVAHDGARHVFGGDVDGPDVTIRLTDAKVERELFFNPELKTAEAYMDGRLVFENGGQIFDLLVRTPGQHTFLVGGRNLDTLRQRTNLSRFAAIQLGHTPEVELVAMNLQNVEQTAETIARFQPEPTRSQPPTESAFTQSEGVCIRAFPDGQSSSPVFPTAIVGSVRPSANS